jgi:hypothetical protein
MDRASGPLEAGRTVDLRLNVDRVRNLFSSAEISANLGAMRILIPKTGISGSKTVQLVAMIALATISLEAAQDATLPVFTDPGRRAKLESAFPEVEEVFERYQQDRGIPGLVFGIVIDGDLAYVKGLGVRNRESSEPVTPETVFRIASMTKSFTALAILKLRDEGEATALAADNLFLDKPAAEFREEIARLKNDLGTCGPAGGMEPMNLLRGSFRMSCDRGTVDIYFTLAPTIPPKVQFLRFTEAIKPGPQVTGAVQSLASLTGSFRKKELARISASASVAGALGPQLEALRIEYGACRVGETLAGDGRTDVRIRFECDRGPLNVAFRFAGNGKLESVLFTRPAETPCVP